MAWGLGSAVPAKMRWIRVFQPPWLGARASTASLSAPSQDRTDGGGVRMEKLDMTTEKAPTSTGLDGVVVAETYMSEVDGEKGRLIIRGHDIEELASWATFEDVCSLLWLGRVPDASLRESLRAELGRARVSVFQALPTLGNALDHADGMDALRACVGQLPAEKSAGFSDEARLTAAVAVFAAAWCRKRAGLAPVAPDATLTHAADYLRMCIGKPSDAARIAGVDRYLVTVSDHGMNASTFTARVIASTDSDNVSAVTGAIGALKGPLHGGAPGPVLDMLDAIGKPENAANWLDAEIASGRRIMGMGHRIYRVRDPRAAVLEKGIEALERAGISTGRLSLARAVESAALGVLKKKHPTRPLAANVEFYTAVMLDSVGLPRNQFTPTFGVGRVVGWMAHVNEQRIVKKLFRPGSTYIGTMPAVASV